MYHSHKISELTHFIKDFGYWGKMSDIYGLKGVNCTCMIHNKLHTSNSVIKDFEILTFFKNQKSQKCFSK